MNLFYKDATVMPNDDVECTNKIVSKFGFKISMIRNDVNAKEMMEVYMPILKAKI